MFDRKGGEMSNITDFLEEIRLLVNSFVERGESRANLINHLEGWAKQVRKYPGMLAEDPLQRLVI